MMNNQSKKNIDNKLNKLLIKKLVIIYIIIANY